MHHVLVTMLIAVLPLSQYTMAAAEPAQDQTAFAVRVVDLTNTERQKAGLAPLTLSDQLQASAAAYSQVLAESGCFAHTCGPVPNFAERDARAGYTGWTNVGENIAAGYSSPEDVVAGWMASPGHRANILSPDYTEIGIGVASGSGAMGTYWAEEFGARDASVASAIGDISPQ